jgi:hypothetical protein
MPGLTEKKTDIDEDRFEKQGFAAVQKQTISTHMMEALAARQPEKLLEFEKDVESLIVALSHHEKAKADFFLLLEKIRAQGLVEMVKQKADYTTYHIAEHAAEATYDTGKVLETALGANFPALEDNFANLFFQKLAQSAVAWHDVVQGLGPPDNEIKSANAFVKKMQQALLDFKKKYPALENDIAAFEKHLIFISNELIVYHTWLVWGG